MTTLSKRIDELEDSLKANMMAVITIAERLDEMSVQIQTSLQYTNALIKAMEIMRYEINQLKKKCGIDNNVKETVH